MTTPSTLHLAPFKEGTMTDREQIEAQVRELLVTETSAIELSNKLFEPPNGLFCRLGLTEEERRGVVQSPLFRAARERLAELREKEVAAFTRAVQEYQAARPEGSFVLKLGPTDRAPSRS
jgi:hypothetical protein